MTRLLLKGDSNEYLSAEKKNPIKIGSLDRSRLCDPITPISGLRQATEFAVRGHICTLATILDILSHL